MAASSSETAHRSWLPAVEAWMVVRSWRRVVVVAGQGLEEANMTVAPACRSLWRGAAVVTEAHS